METDLTSLLSPQSTIREQISAAQSQITFLKQRGGAAAKDADYFSQILAKKIKAQDKTIANDLKRLSLLDVQNIKDTSPQGATKEEPKINEQNAVLEIERALNIGDERGLVLPVSDLKFAAEAIAKGDTKKAADYATRLSSRIESLIKQQDEESKTLVKTPEGEQFSIGDKTGTRYVAGLPASRGNENTGMFNVFASKEFEPTKEAAAGIPIIGAAAQEIQAPEIKSIEAITPEPEVYSAEVTPAKMTSIQEKELAFNRARQLYNSGDEAKAIDLMNAAGGKGMLGPFMAEDLSAMFGERVAQPEPKAKTEGKPKSALTDEQRKKLEEARKKTRKAEPAN